MQVHDVDDLRKSCPYVGEDSCLSRGLSSADLHVCNGLQTDETELRTMFGSQPGFRQIKLNRGARGLTCFVEYDDVVNAMAVHQAQQAGSLPQAHLMLFCTSSQLNRGKNRIEGQCDC